jgi:hypothetical protein
MLINHASAYDPVSQLHACEILYGGPLNQCKLKIYMYINAVNMREMPSTP